MAALAMKKERKQLVDEVDRATLRDYLTRRLSYLRRKAKRASDATEAEFYNGAEMEILFVFDDLLGEQPPDLRKVPKSQ